MKKSRTEYNKEYYQRTQEKQKEYNKEYYQKNKERLLENYKKNANGADNMQAKNRRAKTFIRDLFGKCELCGSTSNLEAHHIKPIGVDEESNDTVFNMLCVCKSCHQSLHALLRTRNANLSSYVDEIMKAKIKRTPEQIQKLNQFNVDQMSLIDFTEKAQEYYKNNVYLDEDIMPDEEMFEMYSPF